jgi:hypothetical protein
MNDRFKGRVGPRFDELAVGDLVDVTTDSGHFFSGRITRLNRVTVILDGRDWLKVRAGNIESVERQRDDGDWWEVWAREETEDEVMA